MCRKLLLLVLLIAAVTGPISYAGLVAYWNLDEGSGAATKAAVGSPPADGRLVGATWIATGLAPTPGNKAAISFRSASADRVETSYPGVLGQAARSVTAWIRAETTQANSSVMVGWGANTNDQRYSVRINKTAADGALNALRLEIQGSRAVATTPLTDRQWHHIAVTHGAGARIGEVSFYVDGKPDAMSGTPATAVINTASTSVFIGNSPHATATYGFDGAVDEVRIYDHVLTPVEIQNVMRGVPPGQASGPSPANKAVDVLRDTTLSWTAGETAGTHDVYFGTTFADVNTAGRTDAKGVLISQGQASAAYEPVGLEYGRTYYWRIDEVNKTPDNTIFTGDVWSFTVESYGLPVKPVAATASSFQVGMGPEKTLDGSGLTGDLHGTEPTTMWLTANAPNWIQYEFDKVYKLHEMQVWNSNQMVEAFLGFGAKSVTIETSPDGAAWTPVANVPEFARAPGAVGYAANTNVNLGGAEAKFVKLTINTNWGGMAPQAGLSEVRFFYVPVQARIPQPATSATGVGVDATLDWRPGRGAASHKVYFGTDPDAVANGTASAKTVTDRGFTPDSLNLGTTYYWKVDEVNAVTYPGEVWSFTTQDFMVVDDFESYTDQAGAEIFLTWADGYVDKSSGSQVGLIDAKNGTFGETTIIHGGKQSMPLTYDNTKTPFYSEAVLTFDQPQDWTAHGIKSLSLWFQGVAGNGGQLYVKINNTKITYSGDALDLARVAWTVWNIDLSKAGKVNSVRSLTVGIEGTGAKGTLYIDDLRLYPKSPEYIAPVAPDATGLQAQYLFDGNANDSSGKGRNGTVQGGATYAAGKVGQALSLDGTDDTVSITGYKGILADPNTGQRAFTVCAWIKTATNGTDIVAWGTDAVSQRMNFRVDTVLRVEFNGGNVRGTDGPSLLDDQWHHVAATVPEGGRMMDVRLYVDGRDVTSVSTTAIPFNLQANVDVTIGRAGPVAGRFFKGLIDDVRIYDRVLSAGEIAGMAGLTVPYDKSF